MVKDYLFASTSTVQHSNNFKSQQWLNLMNCRQVRRSGNDQVDGKKAKKRQKSGKKAKTPKRQQIIITTHKSHSNQKKL